jgi:protein-L-isoaspartate(D-aspartate) O-methyltransferase
MMALTVDFEAMRHAMVASQLRTNAVNDVRVVEAMAVLPREDFLPEVHRAIAYRDTLLPLAGGRQHNSPLATGRLLTAADLRADRQCAADRCRRWLHRGAARRLASTRWWRWKPSRRSPRSPVPRSHPMPMSSRWKGRSPPACRGRALRPADRRWRGGALPDALLEQLALGARVVTGVVDRGVTRLATGRRTEGGFGLTDFVDIECAVLPGFERLRTFQF